MYATTTRTRVLARGLAALVGALLILLGIPTALWIFGGGLPLPTSLPTLSSIWQAMTRPDDGTLFLGILQVAGWLGWASYAIPLLVELVTRLAGLKTPALPAMRLQQRQVAALAGAIAALVSTAGAASAAPATPRPPTISSAGYDIAHSGTAATQEHQQASESRVSTAPTTKVAEPTVRITDFVDQPGQRPFMRVTVEKGDTLWEIAEEELGDGAKWPKIAKASASIRQDDGRRLTDPDLIYPGWDLDVPRPASSPKKAPQQPASPSEQTAPGSAPSEAPSSSSDRASTAPASPSTPAAPGELERASGEDQPSAGTTLAPSSTPSTAPAPATAVPRAPAPGTASPQLQTPTTPAPTTSPQTAAAAPSDPASAHHEAMLAQSGDGARRVATVAGLGSLAAAGLLAFLWLRRAKQQRHRRPGLRYRMSSGLYSIDV